MAVLLQSSCDCREGGGDARVSRGEEGGEDRHLEGMQLCIEEEVLSPCQALPQQVVLGADAHQP